MRMRSMRYSSIFSSRYLIGSYYMSTSDQPAGFGSEPSTGSGMTVSMLGVTSYLRECKGL